MVYSRYYNWNVASALIASTSVYHKQLPVETIEELQEKQMTPTKSRMTSSSSWWPFSGKKVNKIILLCRILFFFLT
jgi:hypothetical protein